MKKIIYLILYISITIGCKAQYNPLSQGSVVLHPELNIFVGTWRWTQAQDTVIIKLQKQIVHYPSPLDYSEENIVGWHYYVKNGVIKESNIQYFGNQFLGGHTSIFGGNIGVQKLFVSFQDLTKSKKCDLDLSLENGSTTNLKWKLRESRGLKSSGFLWGFTLPGNITLIKQ